MRRREHAGAEGPVGSLGSANLDCRQDGARWTPARREFYCFNTTIAGIEEADAILLVGCNPRREAPVMNARIRKRWLAGGMPVGMVGPWPDLTYDVTSLGDRPSVLTALLDGARIRQTLRGGEAADDHRRAGGAGAGRRRRRAGGGLAPWRRRSAR